MKDTLITARRKKIELVTLGVCFLLAFLLNLGCILYYGTSFSELGSQLGYVTVIAVAFYLIWTGIRLIIWLSRRK